MDRPSRKKLRMRGYDYASAGAYFVTICIEDRLPLLGTVHATGVQLTAAGEMVAEVWCGLEERHKGLTLDEWVVMPDHVHGILIQDRTVPERTLSTVLGAWKSWTTRCYREGIRNHGWASCSGRLWQRSFNERVIRTDDDLEAFRRYIIDNPREWWEQHGG